MSSTTNLKGIVVQVASYNTNLQGNLGLPQDLVDWLNPTLTVSNFLTRAPNGPDIVAVGFQELLPLHLGFSGLSRSVIKSRDNLIRSQIEEHAPNKESYNLVAHEVLVGVALLVYARDNGVGRRICDVQTSWTGCGPAWMGNKGAVGVRFRVRGEDGSAGEVFTFVNAHLTAHAPKLKQRINDWNHIARTLLFPSLHEKGQPTTMYSTSHLFFSGDLNFRLDVPASHPLRAHPDYIARLNAYLDTEEGRKELKEHDQLLIERGKNTVFQGLSEAEFWRFKCTYKFKLNSVDQYSTKRIPSWTDRILYATYTDTPDSSKIVPLLYTSIPSYTTSDHKPIVALLAIPPPTESESSPSPSLPPSTSSKAIPYLRNTPDYRPDPRANLKRYVGKGLGRIIGFIWFVFVLLGLGNAAIGISNVVLGMGAWSWWRKSNIELV
ncbi:hypothetical protein M422DRAFT_209364 [Sphaerobolus stellatus SS14]|uniref:Inositol polyphosphate-related phosphatase domain-containing protein n=1 Tax=Sphaerobolus stellatus (strain SS14) TaxID=990650 RepID=A0A0C9VS55_SPHS4|nr:hypothetical protein M422DRAFT_209364 [Sphaerobolus stellatus SS14]